MINDKVVDTVKKSLSMVGQNVKVFESKTAETYKPTTALVKYLKEQKQSSDLIITLDDSYKFILLEPVKVNNQIVWKNNFYNVESVDETQNDIYKAFCSRELETVPQFDLRLDSSNLFVKQNSTVNIVAKVYKDDVELISQNSNIKYTSLNENIAKVNSNGLVTGVSKGTVVIKVTWNDLEVYCTVEVAEIAYTIELSTTSLEVGLGATGQIQATYKIDGVVDEIPSVTYRSSNNSVVTVDETGLITGIGLGSATITVVYYNKTETISVNIIEILEEYKIVDFNGAYTIRRWTSNTFKAINIYNESEVAKFDITINYNGMSTSYITIDEITDNSIKITNNGFTGRIFYITFTKGDIVLTQEVKLIA